MTFCILVLINVTEYGNTHSRVWRGCKSPSPVTDALALLRPAGIVHRPSSCSWLLSLTAVSCTALRFNFIAWTRACSSNTSFAMASVLPSRLLGHINGNLFVFDPRSYRVDHFDIVSYTWGWETQQYNCGIDGVDWDVTIPRGRLEDIKRLMVSS